MVDYWNSRANRGFTMGRAALCACKGRSWLTISVGGNCINQKGQNRPLLKAARLHYRQNPFDKARTRVAPSAKGAFSPQHPFSHQSLGVVICRLDTLAANERPNTEQPELVLKVQMALGPRTRVLES